MPELFDASGNQDGQFLCVDREDVRDDIKRRRHWAPGQLSKVVVYTGPGGIGKTTIRKAIENELLIPGRAPYAVIDYELDSSLRSCETTFCSIRRQLGKFGLRFPAFDLIWARYWEETTQQLVTRNNFPGELADAADIVAVVPLLGNLPTAVVALARLSRSAAHWLSSRFGHGTRDQLQKMNAGDLQRAMPEAMARDLEEMMEERRFRGHDAMARITVIFDAHERLSENGVDDWFVREFCRQAGSVLKIVFGRRMLDWEATHPLWKEHIEHHPALPNLEPKFAAEYLVYRGVDDPNLQRYLIELTDGFPYYLDLAADLCHKIEKETEREPSIQDFVALEESSNLGDALLKRLLRELPDYEYGAVLMASVPRWFNKEILEHLLSEPANLPRVFKTLTRYSFCENVPSIKGAYMIRKEARWLLRLQAQGMKHWTNWNVRLKEFHAQRDTQLLHLAEEIYHSLIVDPDTGLNLFHEHFYSALANWRFADCWTLLQSPPALTELPASIGHWFTLARVSLLHESAESGEHLATAKELIARFLVEDLSPELYVRGLHISALVNIKYGDRLKAHEQLTDVVTRASLLGDKIMQARALKDIGDIEYSLGNSREALSNYKKSLSFLRNNKGVSGKSSQASFAPPVLAIDRVDVLKSIAGLYARIGRTQQAVKPFEEMLAESTATNNLRIRTETLSELGLVYRRLGRLKDAYDAYTECLPLFEQLRLVSGRANAFCGLGMTLEQGGDYEGAAPLYEKAGDLFQQVGDKYGAAKVAHCMARLAYKASDYVQAEDLYNEALRLYREVKSYATSGSVICDLARLKMERGETRTAVLLCREAKDIYEGLEDEAGIAGVEINLGICLYKHGQHAEALANWQEARRMYKKLVAKNKTPQEVGMDVIRNPNADTGLVEALWVSFLSVYAPDVQRGTFSTLEKVISSTQSESAGLQAI
ncbi:MAG: hypothetical protein QOH93_754 [Chloroflexia bacterium]|nr:hypothetical protein [Chloroflexia bacterium]